MFFYIPCGTTPIPTEHDEKGSSVCKGTSGTRADMVSTQEDQILDSVTVANTQSIGAMATQHKTDGTMMENTANTDEPTKRITKSMANSHIIGRSIRNKFGTPGSFRTNRTRIEVTTKPSDVMESKIDRLLTPVEERSQKCLAQDQKINQLTDDVSNARDHILAIQEVKHRSNQLRMTATDASIKEIKAMIEDNG
jgi:hypothetical protein